MRLLLDTHAWIWWNTGSPRLPATVIEAIAGNTDGIMVSAASVWEAVTKHRLGKLPEAEPFIADIEATIEADGFLRLSISTVHAYRAASFGHAHKDPFDRLLMAQALVEDIAIVSNERIFDEFGVRRLWG